MVRPVENVLASQEQMRTRRGVLTPPAARDKMADELGRHRARVMELLRTSANVEVLKVSYPALLDDPLSWSQRVAAFAGLEHARAAAMATVVAPELSHHQTTTPTPARAN